MIVQHLMQGLTAAVALGIAVLPAGAQTRASSPEAGITTAPLRNPWRDQFGIAQLRLTQGADRTARDQPGAPSCWQATPASDYEASLYDTLQLGGRLSAGATASGGNVVFSPHAVGVALSMVAYGSRRDTLREIGAAIPASAKPRADPLVQSSASRSVPDSCQPSAMLSMANAVITTERDALSPQYLAHLSREYAAGIFQGAAGPSIGGWLSERSEGRITRALARLPDKAGVTLLNAAYFTAGWTFPFDPSLTTAGGFRLSGAQDVPVATMRAVGRYTTTRTPELEAIRIPYAGSDDALSMVVILPVDSTIAQLGARMNARRLLALIRTLRAYPPRRLQLHMPRFRIEAAHGLTEVLRDLGVNRAFNPALADLSGMSAQRLHLSTIDHRAFLSAGEGLQPGPRGGTGGAHP